MKGQAFPALRLKGSDNNETAASSEAAIRRMNLEDTSGLLCGMSAGTTINAEEANNIVPSAGE
jgi:chorismate synthase